MKKLSTLPNPPIHQGLARAMTYLAAAVIALIPFHAFLTVWGSSIAGHYTLLRLWKEIVLAVMVVGCTLLLGSRLWRQSDVVATMRRRPIIPLILAYIVLLLGSGLAAVASGDVTPKAFAYGLLLDARFLVFFLVVWLISRHDSWIVAHWRRLVLIPAAIVVIFGLLQAFVLPVDFLKHFGYGVGTIDAVQTIDEKVGYQRIQSTLRGANPLGAYLIVIISALSLLILRSKTRRWMLAVFLALSSAVLAMTFSRSAWIGVVAALGWLIWQAIDKPRTRRWLLIGGGVMLVALSAASYSLRSNDVFQNTFFHTDENSQSSVSSNAGRAAAIRGGLSDIAGQPLGQGTGTAGPASVYNAQQTRIAENYFLQIGQEVGVVGMVLFVAINLCVGWALWLRRQALLPQVLLASLIGISLVNLLSHAWTDDTLCYIWWGLAGAALGAVAVRGKGSADEA